LLLILASVAVGHQELSNLYKAYKAGGKIVNHEKQQFHSVSSPQSNDKKARDESLFVPPLPGQSAVDYHPQLKKLAANETIIYYSWHVHVYFFHENQNVTDRSLALRDQFISTFGLATCNDSCFMGGPFDTCNQGMCVWDPYYGVDGPHPYGQWGVYMPNEYVAETISWMSANHGEFEVLFHPNTGYMVGDHDQNKRAIWIKQIIPLDIDFLVWLQCQWFECSDAVTLEQVKF